MSKQFKEDLYSYHRNTAFEKQLDSKGKLVVRKEVDANLNQKELDKFIDKYGLKIKYVPAKGYQYESGIGFVEKQDLVD